MSHTEILDVDHALVFQPRIINGGILRIRDQATVASLGNSETMDRKTGGLSKGRVYLLHRRITLNLNLLGELLDGFSYQCV